MTHVPQPNVDPIDGLIDYLAALIVDDATRERSHRTQSPTAEETEHARPGND